MILGSEKVNELLAVLELVDVNVLALVDVKLACACVAAGFPIRLNRTVKKGINKAALNFLIINPFRLEQT